MHQHVLEAAETRDERCPSLLYDVENTTDIRRMTCERCCNRRLGLRKRDSDVGCLERSAIIGSISAHQHRVPQRLQPFYYFIFLIR